MANRFRFQLLTGTDPDAQYAAITTIDPYCFYLLNNGKGYLGSVMLFGSLDGLENSGVVVKTDETLTTPETGKLYIFKNVTYGTDSLTGVYQYDGTNMVSFTDAAVKAYLDNILLQDYADTSISADADHIPTAKAVKDLVTNSISDALGDSDILNAKFFRLVESHVITADDLTNTNISIPAGTVEGDVGLLFTADNNETSDGNEKFFFVNLKEYLKTRTTVAGSDVIDVQKTTDPGTGEETFTVDLIIPESEKSIVKTTDGLTLKRFTATDTDVHDGDGTEKYGPEPDPDKLVTEKAMVIYIQDKVLTAVSQAIEESLADVVTWTEDPPKTTTPSTP